MKKDNQIEDLTKKKKTMAMAMANADEARS